MTRSDIVLAGMAAAGLGAKFDAVQLQKLFFLIDREIPELIGGPHFDFRPHHYGPFDGAVYDVLDGLLESGDASADTSSSQYPLYSLTASGAQRGVRLLEEMHDDASGYMREASDWIVATPFQPLLAAIYRQYPDMAQNSVVPHLARPYPRATFRYPMPSLGSGMSRALDLFGTLDDFETTIGDAELDALATYNDWRAIGEDMEAAMATVCRQRLNTSPPARRQNG